MKISKLSFPDFCHVSRTLVGGRCFVWSVVCGRFSIWSVVCGRWSIFSLVGGFYGRPSGGRLVIWLVFGVLHFYWSMVDFYFREWSVVGVLISIWSVVGGWSVVLYYAGLKGILFSVNHD